MHEDSEHFRATSSPVIKALAGLLALAVAMGIGRFAFTPVLPMMLQDTGLTITGGAMLASANYLGYLIGALAATALRLSPRRPFAAGCSRSASPRWRWDFRSHSAHGCCCVCCQA